MILRRPILHLTSSPEKKPTVVMLSVANHLASSVTYEEEILRLSPQDDIVTSLPGEKELRSSRRSPASPNRLEPIERFERLAQFNRF